MDGRKRKLVVTRNFGPVSVSLRVMQDLALQVEDEGGRGQAKGVWDPYQGHPDPTRLMSNPSGGSILSVEWDHVCLV